MSYYIKCTDAGKGNFGPFDEAPTDLGDRYLINGLQVFKVTLGNHTITQDDNDAPEPVVAPVKVPDFVTMAQARKAMILSGVSIANVDSAIAAIVDADEKALAEVDWEYSTTVRRNSPLVASLAPALGLSDAQVDAMFVLAGGL